LGEDVVDRFIGDPDFVGRNPWRDHSNRQFQ
jgi:hypothetical protein